MFCTARHRKISNVISLYGNAFCLINRLSSFCFHVKSRIVLKDHILLVDHSVFALQNTYRSCSNPKQFVVFEQHSAAVDPIMFNECAMQGDVLYGHFSFRLVCASLYCPDILLVLS